MRQSPTMGLAEERSLGGPSGILARQSGGALENAVQGTVSAGVVSRSVWLGSGLIPADIVLGNVALLLTLPALAAPAGSSGFTSVPAL